MAALAGGRVVIIGGGIVGASIAYNLSIRGYRDVTVIERNLVGEGATARATGGIRHQFSARVNIELVQRSMPFWTEFEERTGSRLQFRRHGYLFLISDPAVFGTFRANAELQKSLGVQVEILDPAHVSGVFPGIRTDDLVGATYTPGDGSASPADAVAGYLRAARANGTNVHQQSHFIGLRTDRYGAVQAVQTSDGIVEAEQVIIAAGPQSRTVGRQCGVDIPVFPHSRQAFTTAPIEALNGSMPLTVDMATGAYVHPEANGATAVIGGNDRDVPSSEVAQVDWSRVSGLAEALSNRFPVLENLEIVRGWAGLREMTPDDHAIVGPVDAVPGLWVAAGFSGHGFMQSPAVGEALAQWLLDGSPDLDLDPLRLERFGGRTAAALETAVF
ncbi:NAD(P)/FAD-dependent oxidoreductase [Saccharopolyspora phatthalungensis]|uniref:Sarcosine oxidase subunit beta n=1 Tax=Saccharopolyspora phatthalungensis TaxID=664693 RepID=A0A840QIW6_9PSEU|nr:FAD-binding oxidoreductase [Saccharopolyspora phatthalungensis]MBB5158615.1 sarcosine oxidase subunit beta [Saccharopolyspora phatthalungensis]